MQNNKEIKEKYPVGTCIELISMEGESRMQPGITGTVEYVDDIGQIHMKWSNGSSLALIEGTDDFKVVYSNE